MAELNDIIHQPLRLRIMWILHYPSRMHFNWLDLAVGFHDELLAEDFSQKRHLFALAQFDRARL